MSYSDRFKEVLTAEANAIERLISLVDDQSIDKVRELFEMLISTGGNLVFCGVGKSGLICQKIAATFSSLGLPSYFLHPTEALHGDLGRVSSSDVVCLISKSGTTEEILKLIPFIKIPKAQRIALVGNPNSPIASISGIVFDCSVEKEACLNNQAPTTSTTAAMVIGDALAVIYEHITGLSKEGFALNHPGGLLGKSLSLKVEMLMVSKEECALVKESAALKDVILQMTEKPVGMCSVVENGELKGIISEGDIRRALGNHANPLDMPVSSVMTKGPISIAPTELAYRALELMEKREREISVLPVLENDTFLGVIRLHDLLKAGFTTSN